MNRVVWSAMGLFLLTGALCAQQPTSGKVEKPSARASGAAKKAQPETRAALERARAVAAAAKGKKGDARLSALQAGAEAYEAVLAGHESDAVGAATAPGSTTFSATGSYSRSEMPAVGRSRSVAGSWGRASRSI